MMNNAGTMNQMMINNDGMDIKKVYLLIENFGEDNYVPIIINKNDDITTV